MGLLLLLLLLLHLHHLLLLLLHLLLALLEVLQDLFRSARNSSALALRKSGGPRRRGDHGWAVDRGQWLFLHLGLIGHIWRRFSDGTIEAGLIPVGPLFPGAQYDLSRSTSALFADHQDVIFRSVQELRDDVVRLSWPIFAEDSLIGAKAFDLAPVALDTSSRI